MAAALHISRLLTRVRVRDPGRALILKDQVRGLATGHLQRAFEAACPLALARAGLPGHAFVAVRRLHLRLIPRGDVAGDDLAAGWARALQEALARALLSVDETVDDGEDDLVWFADDWAAEEHYLAAQGRDEIPWWAGSLPTAGAPGMPPTVVSVLDRWLDADPARTLAAMVRLLRRSSTLVRCLSRSEAESLVRAMLRRIGASLAQGHGDRAASGPSARSGVPEPGLLPDPADGDGAVQARDTLEMGVADLVWRMSVALPPDLWSVGPEQRGPWVLAQLLSLMPSLGRLPPPRLLALIVSVTGPREGHRPPAVKRADVGEPSFLSDPVAGQHGEAPWSQPPSDVPLTDVSYPPAGTAAELVETFAGGLLLLIRPLVRLDLLPPGPEAGALLGDLALVALRSVLAPLPPGEQAVAQERERALLGVFAPERDWRAPIRAIPVAQPARAQALLDRLQAEIPADTAAVGGLRSVFGATLPSFHTEPERRLAYLLLRPGRLLINDCSAELVWPLAGIDLALRRAGWDQDPGWVPWLGRVIRFRFEAGP